MSRSNWWVLGLACTATLGACGGIDRLTASAGAPGAPTLAAQVLGSWRFTIIVQAPSGDVQSNETNWTFESSLACRRLLVIRSTGLAFPDSTLATCTYVTRSAEIDILFDGTSVPATFDARVRADTLFLDAFPFIRVN